MEARRVIDEFAVSITREYNKIIEQRIMLVLNPKPRYIPKRVWEKLLRAVLRMEIRNGN